MIQQVQDWFRKSEKTLIILIGSLGLTVTLLSLDLNFLEANLYDLRMSYGIQPDADPNIILVTIDEKTTQALDEYAPLSMRHHTQLMEILAKTKLKSIGYLVNMNHVKHMNSNQAFHSWAWRFITAANQITSDGGVFLLGTSFNATGEVIPPPPLQILPHSISIIYKEGNTFSEDRITRRALLSIYNRPAFHLEIAQSLSILPKGQLPKGSFYIPQVDGNYFFFRYHTSKGGSLDDAQKAAYRKISMIDILKGQIDLNELTNKILLVGTFSLDDLSATPKLVVHANILDSVLNNDGITKADRIVNWAVTFFVITIVLWWIMSFTPIYGVFATFLLALTFISVSRLLFQYEGIWLRESQPLVGIFVSYYLAVPYRLIQEYKKRWDYQKKNLLLNQVEELKTNFLSLVTHDLKTPVARIQGLTETLLRHSENPESNKRLKHILSSTEELNRFISSILELSKVESNHLQLQFESKDINTLIERSVEDFSTQARSKGVKIECQLEPLFPIKIDSSLISKVLNNLIDNAIKYSEPGSQIEIRSEEEKDWVVVTVKDEGIGMTCKERELLFTRFYRAKNDTTVSIPGTGLGLYLTKYFIEAHCGKVSVESEIGRGSLFRICLPNIDHPSSKELSYV